MAKFSEEDQKQLQELLSKLMEDADRPESVLSKMAKRGAMTRWDQPLPSGGQLSGMNTMLPVSTGDMSKIPSIMEGIGGMLGLAQGVASMADAGAFTKGKAKDYWKHDFLGMTRPEQETATGGISPPTTEEAAAAAMAQIDSDANAKAASMSWKDKQDMTRGMYTGTPSKGAPEEGFPDTLYNPVLSAVTSASDPSRTPEWASRKVWEDILRGKSLGRR